MAPQLWWPFRVDWFLLLPLEAARNRFRIFLGIVLPLAFGLALLLEVLERALQGQLQLPGLVPGEPSSWLVPCPSSLRGTVVVRQAPQRAGHLRERELGLGGLGENLEILDLFCFRISISFLRLFLDELLEICSD